MVRRYYSGVGRVEDCETFCDDYDCDTVCEVDSYGRRPHRYGGYKRDPYRGHGGSSRSHYSSHKDYDGDDYERRRRAYHGGRK